MSTKTSKRKKGRPTFIRASRREARQDATEDDLDFDAGVSEAVIWRSDAAFGDYMRQIREEAGFSLRQAAEVFGTSFSYLQRLEKGPGARHRPPTMRLIEKVARAYGRDLDEVMHAAGFRRNVPPDIDLAADIHVLFDALISEPGLRPIALEQPALAYYSTLQKQQVVDLALKVEEHLAGGGKPIHKILEEAKRDQDTRRGAGS
jgi:transcriptional regulator with XRE-family HTH domain